MRRAYSRFVALGDSQTEGLDDGDEVTGYRGWADRLAETLAATTSPGLAYANLAVRGCRARHVVEQQLPAALALEPDLAAVVVGMNDLLRHDFDLDATIRDVRRTVGALAERGCHVVTMTFPDIGRMLPVLSWLRPREEALNRGIVEVAAAYDAPVLDLYPLALCGDPRIWSGDRIHGSPLGHQRIAAGMAHLIGLPGADPSWSVPPPGAAAPSRVRQAGRDAWWVATFLVPFLGRQLRGHGPMGDHGPKRPSLEPVRSGVDY